MKAGLWSRIAELKDLLQRRASADDGGLVPTSSTTAPENGTWQAIDDSLVKTGLAHYAYQNFLPMRFAPAVFTDGRVMSKLVR